MVTRRGYPLREDIWWADLDPIVGSEQAGRRPVLIVSSNAFHRIQSSLVTIVPMTSTHRPRFAFSLSVTSDDTGLDKSGSILCDQIRTISTQRLIGQRPIGRVTQETMEKVDDLIRVVLGMY